MLITNPSTLSVDHAFQAFLQSTRVLAYDDHIYIYMYAKTDLIVNRDAQHVFELTRVTFSLPVGVY